MDTRVTQRRVDRAAAEHAVRGAALHVRLRGLLVVFAIAAVYWAPPDAYTGTCRGLAIGYGVWAVAVLVWFRLDPADLVRLTWLVLSIDLLLFGLLNQFAGVSDQLSWTAYILVNGFVVIPLLATAQLQPRLAAAIGFGAAALYLVSSISARQANGEPGSDGEPWSSVVLRTVVVLGVAIGAVLLTRLQRSRVADIQELADQRAQLLEQLGRLEDRQRRDLAEALHDGALQYLLGARMELEDARDTGDLAAFARIDEALTTSVALLRSTVGQLHPAVLTQAGLAQALRDLAVNTELRSRLQIDVAILQPDDRLRDDADLVVYSAVRELLNNVVKHADAQHVRISMARHEAGISVVVADDGTGIAGGQLERKLAQGHIGISSHRLRVEAAGGRLLLEPADPHGTVATVEIPVHRSIDL